MNSYLGPPMTPAAAHMMLIVGCIDCRHEVEPKPLNRRAHCAENHRMVERWKG
jgi:hypothetical protein